MPTMPPPYRTSLRSVLPVSAGVALTGAACGATAVAEGFPVWVPVLLALLVLAGASEVLVLGMLAGGAGPLTAAAAATVLNARHLAYGVSVGDATGTGLRSWWRAHLVNDESVAFVVAAPPPARRAALLASGTGIAIAWPSGTLVGGWAGASSADPAALGLDAVFPALLLALVLSALRRANVRRAALTGTLLALVTTPWAPPGLPVLAALGGLLLLHPHRGDRGRSPRGSAS